MIDFKKTMEQEFDQNPSMKLLKQRMLPLMTQYKKIKSTKKLQLKIKLKMNYLMMAMFLSGIIMIMNHKIVVFLKKIESKPQSKKKN